MRVGYLSVVIVFAAAFAAPPAAGQGSVQSYGAGCQDSNGRTPVLSTFFLPAIGNSAFSFTITMASALQPSYVFGALAPATPPVGLGFGSGCTVHIDLASAAMLVNAGLSPLGPVTTATNGTANHPFPIPPIPALAGFSLYVQAVAIDPALTLGFVVSNALCITMG